VNDAEDDDWSIMPAETALATPPARDSACQTTITERVETSVNEAQVVNSIKAVPSNTQSCPPMASSVSEFFGKSAGGKVDEDWNTITSETPLTPQGCNSPCTTTVCAEKIVNYAPTVDIIKAAAHSSWGAAMFGDPLVRVSRQIIKGIPKAPFPPAVLQDVSSAASFKFINRADSGAISVSEK
jgi:hypothetical protein